MTDAGARRRGEMMGEGCGEEERCLKKEERSFEVGSRDVGGGEEKGCWRDMEKWRDVKRRSGGGGRSKWGRDVARRDASVLNIGYVEG